MLNPTVAWIEQVAQSAPFDAEISSAEWEMLARAGQSAAIEPAQFDIIIRNLCEQGPLHTVDRTRFDLAVDYLFGHGFRDPELPEVGDDYRSFLDGCRRDLGYDDETFVGILIEAADGQVLPQLTGEMFVRALREIHARAGLPVPRLPARHVVGRAELARLHQAVHALGLSFEQHVNVLVVEGGGCLRSCDLDERGLQRVMARYLAAGCGEPLSPPRMPPAPGFITQAQTNLICRLGRDIGLASYVALAEWLETVVGLEGGLRSLTARGAGYVIDRMLGPVVAMRIGSQSAEVASISA